MPVIATLDDLDEAALKNILTEPKNALTKQYRKLFEMEGVDLKFTDDALSAIAEKAIQRKNWRTWLACDYGRSVDGIVYEVPGMENVSEVVINADVINGKAEAVLSTEPNGQEGEEELVFALQQKKRGLGSYPGPLFVREVTSAISAPPTWRGHKRSG